MNYQSIADLTQVVRENLALIPEDVDLIVGIPRSGMLPAINIAMNLNLKFCDINALQSNATLGFGETRKTRHTYLQSPFDAKHILVVDDSVDSGGSMKKARGKISVLDLQSKVSYCSIYVKNKKECHVDISFKILSLPRVFEWNVMHRKELSTFCVDIDGVLCHDPSDQENDDGSNYLHFLLNAIPLARPSYKIGHLVTSRLEKYRSQTEQWLKEHGIEYDELHMLDLPDAATRRALGCHASFKADVYNELPFAKLFIESDPRQSIEIARLTGKHVLCFSNQQMYAPSFNYATTRTIAKKGVRFIRRMIGRSN